MPIHIGELIKKRAEELRMPQEVFGAKINRTKQNVGDIYKRPSIDTALLWAISVALEWDFFAVYYGEEPLKSLRERELEPYQKQIEALKKELAYKEQRIVDLERAVDSDKKLISLLEEKNERYEQGGRKR